MLTGNSSDEREASREKSKTDETRDSTLKHAIKADQKTDNALKSKILSDKTNVATAKPKAKLATREFDDVFEFDARDFDDDLYLD